MRAQFRDTHTHTPKEIVNASCTIVYATCLSVFPAVGIGGRGGDVEENCVRFFFFGDVLGFRDIKETQALYFIVKHRLEKGRERESKIEKKSVNKMRVRVCVCGLRW